MSEIKIGHHPQAVMVLKERFGNNPIIGVEIGTAGACLTKVLLWTFPNLVKLYTIDPWTYRPGTEFESGLPQDHHDTIKAHALNCLKEFGDRVKILEIGSDEAIKHISEKVDFVWIDGDHEEKQVKRDIDNYHEIVKQGGLIGGHDFGQVPLLTNQIRLKYGDRIHTGNDFTWWVYL